MKNLIYLFLIAFIMIAVSTCSSSLGSDKNSSQTGLIDKNGNIVQDTLVYTNKLYFPQNTSLPIWATNTRFSFSLKTNSDGSISIEYSSDVLAPNLTDDASDYYKIFVPYSGKEYYTVSYKDTNRLKQLWLDQIFRKGMSDKKVFAIRNRANNRDINNFQNNHEGRYDYYYFNDNGDLVYKGGDKDNTATETLIKRFVGAVIVDYRKCTERTDWHNNNYAADKIENTGEYTVGAIYKMSVDVNDARQRFAGNDATDGAYDFIAARKWIWFFNNDFVQDKVNFIRQFYNTNFMEVLVLNHHANEDNKNCLGVDSYYAYYGNYRSTEGDLNVDGFTSENYPYMTDENLYLAHRPEYIVPLLTHTTTFTDASRNFKYLAMPGHKY